MRQILRHWHHLTMPHATEDDQAHREYLTKVILLMMGGTLLIFTLIIIGLFFTGRYDLLTPTAILVIDISILAGLWLAQRGHWKIASFIPPIGTYIVGAYLNSNGGPYTTGYLYYMLAILLTAMLIGIKAQWLMVVIVMVSSVYFGVSLWNVPLIDVIPDLIMVGAASIGAGLLQWVSTNQLKRWLTQSRGFSSELSDRTAELSHANLALRQTGERLEILHQVDQAVLAAQSPEEIAQAVVSHIRRLAACQRASISLFDFKTGKGMILAAVFHETTEFKNGKIFPLHQFSGISEMWRGQHRLVNNLQTFSTQGTIEETLIREGLKTILNVPLLVHGDLIGALNLGSEKPYAFQQEHIDIAYELAGSVAVAIQNTRLFQETREQTKMLASLNKIALETSSVLEKNDLIHRLYQQVERILTFDMFMVVLYLAETDAMRIEFALEDGLVVNEWIGKNLSAQESGLNAWMLKERQPLLINDLNQETSPVDPFLGNNKARSWLGVPMVTRDRVIGALSVQSYQTNAFNENQLHFMESLAGQVAVSLENAALYSEARRRADELQTLSDIAMILRNALSRDEMLPGLLEKATTVLGADLGSLFLIERDSGDLVAGGWHPSLPHLNGARLPAGKGVIGRVMSSGEMQIEEKIGNDPIWTLLAGETGRLEKVQSTIHLPLRANEQTIGVINFGSSGNQILKPDKLGLATAIADMAANAIWRATLFEETQQRFNHLLALRMIDRAITSNPELSLILDILLDQVLTQLNVNAANVLLYSDHTQMLDFAAERGFRTDALQGTHLSLGEGHAGRAALEQRIIQIDNLADFYGEFHRSILLNQEGFHTYFAVPLIAKGQIKGVLEIFHRSVLHPDRDWLDLLDALATQTALAIDNAMLFENLQSANSELIKAYDATIEGWSRALDLRDEETEGHSQRVTRMTLRLAREMGVRPEELVNIQRGALLHDIGKMGIPDRILHKPASLNDEEWIIMRQHPIFAYQFLSPIEYLRPALDIPYCHHEKWDGSGYPRGLKGEQIPLAARIFTVVDVWDALSSKRPYRQAWDRSKILDYIANQSGSHFDPRVVNTFLKLLERATFPDSLILLSSD